MNNPLQILRDKHNLGLPDDKLQSIVNTCAEIIVIQDQEEFNRGMMEAEEALNSLDEVTCDYCGDYSGGYECTCNDLTEDEKYPVDRDEF